MFDRSTLALRQGVEQPCQISACFERIYWGSTRNCQVIVKRLEDLAASKIGAKVIGKFIAHNRTDPGGKRHVRAKRVKSFVDRDQYFLDKVFDIGVLLPELLAQAYPQMARELVKKPVVGMLVTVYGRFEQGGETSFRLRPRFCALGDRCCLVFVVERR
ncbi:hypothetical protein BSFA1_74880 (plasmid) [Burkholderia sp. SFA1]|nr:hypothetical protein BSFA1_74880 [Burkholderia sp. SFA1]